MSAPVHLGELHPHLADQGQHRHLAAAVLAVVAVISVGWGASQLVSTRYSGHAADAVGAAPAPVGPSVSPPLPSAVNLAATVTAPTITVTTELPAPPGMTVTLVMLMETSGAVVGTEVPVDGMVRFDRLSEGSYEVVTQAETGVSTATNGAAISAAIAQRSDPIAVPANGSLVIKTH